MKPHQYNSIITNARQGRPVSSRNRLRAGRVNRPAVLILIAFAAVWVGVAVLITSIAR